MKILGGLVISALFTAATVGSVSAADLSVKAPRMFPAPAPVFSWTGLYIGVNGGWAWNDTSGDTFCTNPAGVDQGVGCPIFPNGNLKPSGGFGGGQIGYNYQSGQFVWGVELDIQGGDISDSVTLQTAGIPLVGGGALTTGTFSQSQKLDWFGTVRGRLGWAAWDRTLLYVTGGLIYGHESVSELVAFPNGTTYAASDSSVQIGGTVGGGLEYAFTPQFTGRIEGLWFDMGDVTITGAGHTAGGVPTGFTQSSTFNFTGGLVRGALNFRF